MLADLVSKDSNLTQFSNPIDQNTGIGRKVYEGQIL
jgi:hypothetical protein